MVAPSQNLKTQVNKSTLKCLCYMQIFNEWLMHAKCMRQYNHI